MKPKIIAFMNAYSQGKSGGDMVFIEIAKRLREYDKIVVTSYLGKKLCRENGLKGTYFITTTETEFRNVIVTYTKRIVKAFFLKLSIQKKDIFIGTSDFLPDVLPIVWLKLKNRECKWIQHVFHLIPDKRRVPFLAQKVSLFFIRTFADSVVVDNKLLKNELVHTGLDSKRITVNHPGINLDYLKLIKPAKIGYDGVFMAQFRKSKGIFDLIEIWKLVCNKLPKARLAIIGKGNRAITQEIKTKIKSAGLAQNIFLLGFLEDKKAFSLIKASKVFVFPSHEEGFGIAALEAQALGLPVVAWNLPVFSEIFPKGMRQVPIGNMKEFAREILNLLINKKNYQKLSKEAFVNANKYNWDKTTATEIDIIKSLSQ